jgi:predicted secreted Zn-dependent protease
VTVEQGHLKDFDLVSAYTYYIVGGNGTFHLDHEALAVQATDVIVAPPKTCIHYFGKMEIVLTVSSQYDERNERCLGFVASSESPYR